MDVAFLALLGVVETHAPVHADGLILSELDPRVVTLEGFARDNEVVDEASFRRRFTLG